jgi:6-phosphogluconolactonase
MKVFAGAAELAEALAAEVAISLASRIASHGAATLAVSGGTTPQKFFEALSGVALDWGAVTVTLVDDRWVPESSPRSNAGLVKKHLLQDKAAAAKFIPLVNGEETPEAGLEAANEAIGKLRPFTAVILGMGTDGHTASFFPGGDRLAEALAPAEKKSLETMRAPGAEEPRITLTLPVLLEAGYLALHIEGAQKRAVLDRALSAGDVAEMPVRAVLAGLPGPKIFWSP